MIDVNVTLLIQMANVLVLLFLMNLVLYRPIRRIVAERKAFIDERQAKIDRVDAEADEVVREFDAKIMDARKVGREKIREMKGAAHEQEKGFMQEATEAAAAQVQAMRAQVVQEIAGAREELSAQIQAFSMELARKILGRNI